MRRLDVLGRKSEDVVVGVQEHPGQIFDVHISPPAHLLHDCRNEVLGNPDENETHWAQLGNRDFCQLPGSFCADSPRNLPTWVDEDSLYMRAQIISLYLYKYIYRDVSFTLTVSLRYITSPETSSGP